MTIMEQPASPPSTSVAPPRPPVAPSYAPVNRLAPRWVQGAGRRASAAPEPDCVVQPWMYGSRPRRMEVRALPRRRSASWLLWLMVLALAGLGVYGLSGMDRDQAPALGMHAGSLVAEQDAEEGMASVAVPPAVAAAHEASVREDRGRPAELAAAMPPMAAPAASAPAPAAPGAGAQSPRSSAVRAGAECSDAMAAMQLCGVSSSR